MSIVNDLTLDKTFELAVQNHKENNLQVAKKLYNEVLEIDPNHSIAFNNLALLYEKLEEYKNAIDCLKKSIEINPSDINTHNNLGVILKELGDYDQAKICFEKAIKINPNNSKTFSNLGVVLNILGQYEKALSIFEQGLKLDPSSITIQKNITKHHIDNLVDFKKATDSSYKTLKIYGNNLNFINKHVSLFRLKHDVEQAKYITQKSDILKSQNYKIDGIDEFQKIGSEILDRKENIANEDNFNKQISLNPNEINSLLPFYKSDHIYQTKKISGSCINLNKNWQDVEDEYLNSTNQIMYIDNFLSDEALMEFREFCLVSKVWNKEYYNPFLGAYSSEGFISPIHLQIAIDLKKELPKLFGPHRLGNFWGFKYDSKLGKGINVHADFALHNLNFWITPDEYNNNKNTGGLKVYDVPAPDHWNYKSYNMNSNKIYDFLKERNANCTNIPYKFNRAVLFNSAYFHETDEIDFKDDYVGRRINSTYLFGSRVVKKW
tara:strand:- start:34 stop:1509 length:1476 start_codon:yes stop_codon:yes gene_type:complete